MQLDYILGIIVLVFGFGFVIFFHELGHFLAAKWAGVKVEQFAVGFGHAIVSWRKGLGFRMGTSAKEYERRIEEYLSAGKEPIENQGGDRVGYTTEQLDRGAQALGLSDTEYRLNWIPLGGYVKMLGQDDRPGHNEEFTDPKAYPNKTIGQRMVIVSAGVIMNIILAAIGFMIVFLMGFRVQPSMVGGVLPSSPAQEAVDENRRPAPLRPGDRILMFDGKWQHDFTKITLNTALAEENAPVLAYVLRRQGHGERVWLTPRKAENDAKSFLAIGIEPPVELRGLNRKEAPTDADLNPELLDDNALVLRPGETITAVNGQKVQVQEYHKLYDALQTSQGQPVPVTITNASGRERPEFYTPHLQRLFDDTEMNFAGMLLRPTVAGILEDSVARGKLKPGDAILEISDKDQSVSNPTAQELMDKLNAAGENGTAVRLVVLRRGQRVDTGEMKITAKVPGKNDRRRYGLGIGLGYDEQNAVVAGVMDNSPAARAGIRKGTQIAEINGQPVRSWFDVKEALGSAAADQAVILKDEKGDPFKMILDAAQVKAIASYVYTPSGSLLLQQMFHEFQEPRKTNNPLVAASWGVTETRDFVLQFYLTLQRMTQGSVSYKNMMGPVGIFQAGTAFAGKGTDWLIWFLAMISANLAVVNFLPIPIVDGGLFLFLIIEKVRGKPLSPYAQSVAQYIGLALIVGVFLLVTYQDIMRIR